MEIKRQKSLNFVVAAGFVLVIAVGWALAYFSGQLPNAEAACSKQCAALGKNGELSYVFKNEVTAGMRGNGSQECQCK
jgi:hydrogenase/urease accessory protein HupE